MAQLKRKLAEAESRDNRRAVILADVLEKTARSYQKHLTASLAKPGVAPAKSTEETDR